MARSETDVYLSKGPDAWAVIEAGEGSTDG